MANLLQSLTIMIKKEKNTIVAFPIGRMPFPCAHSQDAHVHGHAQGSAAATAGLWCTVRRKPPRKPRTQGLDNPGHRLLPSGKSLL